MRKASAPTLFVVGLLVLAAVAAITYGVGTVAGLDDDEDTVAVGGGEVPTPTSDPGLTAAQVSVTGTATAIAIRGAVLTIDVVLPSITTPAAGLGAGARFADVLVDGDRATISWDAGRPLAMGAETPLQVRAGTPVNLLATAAGIAVVFVDGVAYPIVPGDYRIDAPVAVTTTGLGSPEDSVVLTAGVDSTVAFGGDAGGTLPYGPVSATGPGAVRLQGTFEVHRPDGTVTAATTVLLESGSFRIVAAPTADGTGFDITEVILEGPVTTT